MEWDDLNSAARTRSLPESGRDRELCLLPEVLLEPERVTQQPWLAQLSGTAARAGFEVSAGLPAYSLHLTSCVTPG